MGTVASIRSRARIAPNAFRKKRFMRGSFRVLRKTIRGQLVLLCAGHLLLLLPLPVSMMTGIAVAGARVPLTAEKVQAMVRISSLSVSPDGKWAASARSVWDPRTDKKSKSIWLTSLDPGSHEERMLTPPQKSGDQKSSDQKSVGEKSSKAFQDDSPVFSPDSQTVAFISNRSGSEQIWTVPTQGGTPKQLTFFPIGVNHLKWSPRGNYLSFSARVFPDSATLELSVAKEKKLKAEMGDAFLFDHLMVRHWNTWADGKRQHLFVLPVKKDADWKVAGTPVDLMPGLDADSPGFPRGEATDYSWSPDESEVAYTTQLGDNKPWTLDANIYLASLSSPTKEARCISCDNPGVDGQPAFSPDGRWIATVAMERPGYKDDRGKVVLMDRKTSEKKVLTESWDRSVDTIEWSPDSQVLYLTADEGGRRKIFALSLGGRILPEVEGFSNSEVRAIPKGTGADRLVFLQSSFLSPSEIFTFDRKSRKLAQLTNVNHDAKTSVEWSKPEEFFFEGAKREQVQGWLFRPVGFEEGRRYPVALVIHGGPHSVWSDSFSFRWNPELFAEAGYGVVMINFHGSTGFGQKFTDSVSGDWGVPYEDLMKGLDFVLQKNRWMDGSRVAALGASYGGYMINWINGHTDRFKCLVNHAGIFNLEAFYFTVDELHRLEFELKGTPWENKAVYDRFNPAKFIDNWKTPTLFIHGGRDYLVPDANSLGPFTFMQRKGIPSKLLYFPEETHWVLKPKNSVLWHKTVFEWLQKWVGEK